MRWVPLTIALLLGCADPCADLAATPSLELGGAPTGDGAFTALGDDVTMETGIQGGAHVWLHARIAGICPDRAVLDRRIVDAATSEAFIVGRGPVEFVPLEDGRFELAQPVRMQLCPNPAGSSVDGRALRFVVNARDDEGRTADARHAFTARCADAACESFCAAE